MIENEFKKINIEEEAYKRQSKVKNADCPDDYSAVSSVKM